MTHRLAPAEIRNREPLVVLYRGGQWISEALALRPKDLDEEQGTIRVLHGKGDRSRVVGLDPGAWAIVELWLQKRALLGHNGRQPLFCTLQGEPMESSYVRSLMKRLGAKAGVEKRDCATPTPLNSRQKASQSTRFSASWVTVHWPPPTAM